MSEHPNKVAFEEGVGYVLKSWTALKLAVEQDWGGVESGEKRDWMIGIVVDYFGKHGKKVDIEEIEDILAQIMVDEFEVILEDDSPYLIAKHLVELYGQCVNGNHAEVDRLREKFKTQNQFAASNCVKQSGDDDSDDDDNNQNDQGGNDEDDDEDMDEAPQEPEEPLVDEDGWETVRRK